ncbi:MAG TPA: ComF family protein [Rhodocyclaceae bacterium]|nr:ComF family protein [Rhodocyclaceae bacterium]
MIPALARYAKYLAVVLPSQDCLLCGAPSGHRLLCGACEDDLPLLSDACPVCAQTSPEGTICGRCLAHPPHFDQTFARWIYAFPVDRLVQALKYGHQLAVGRFLGDALLSLPPPQRPDLLLPVPLSAGHLKARGFNQAVEIARSVSRALDIPLAVDVCVRSLETAPQAGLPWKARQKNIRGAFECRVDLTGKHVAVIDDVMTTGATLNELARTLKKHGAASVTNWVCARALKP